MKGVPKKTTWSPGSNVTPQSIQSIGVVSIIMVKFCDDLRLLLQA